MTSRFLEGKVQTNPSARDNPGFRKARACNILVLSILVCMQGCDLIDTGPNYISSKPRDAEFVSMEIIPEFPSMMYMKDLLVLSDQSVYIVGYTDNRRGQMWYYDGKTLKEVLFPRPDFSGGAYQFTAIAGTNSQSLWVAGWIEIFSGGAVYESTAVFHFNDSQWSEVGPRYKGVFQSVEATDPFDVWFGGTTGFMVRFDGSGWAESPLPTDGFVSTLSRTADGSLFAMTYPPNFDTNRKSLFLTYDLGSWTVKDSTFSESGSAIFGVNDLYAYSNKLFSVGASGCFVFDGIWKRLQPAIFEELLTIQGYSSSNLFLGGVKGRLVHFNGSDFFPLSGIASELDISSIELTSKRLFAVANDVNSGRSFLLVSQ